MNDVAAWLIAITWIYTAAGMILAAALIIALGITAYWTHRLIRWAAGRARHRSDLRRMRRRPQRPPPAGEALDDYWTCCRTWAKPTREESKR